MYLQNNTYLQNQQKLLYPQEYCQYQSKYSSLTLYTLLSYKHTLHHHNTNRYHINRHTTKLLNYISTEEHIKNKIFHHTIKNKLTKPIIK